MIGEHKPSPRRVWLKRIGYALMIGGVTIALMIAISAIYRGWFNAPPLTVTSLNPPSLGNLCPGDELFIHNEVDIRDDIIVFYYVSTMDEAADRNYPGTQRAYVDNLHPHPAQFRHELPWTVPNLPPGRYTRVFGVRNVGADQDVVFVITPYEIAPNC